MTKKSTRLASVCSALFACVAAVALAQDPAPAKPEGDKPAAKPALVVPDFGNATCPIMGKPVSKSLYATTERGRIYVCCKPCIKKIEKDVEKAWKTAYPVVKPAENEACPLTSKPVDARVPRVELQSAAIALCCPKCEPKAKAATQVALAKAHDAKLVDLENRACPITGEEADVDTIGVIDGSIVRFAHRKARTEAEKDPTAALAKAKTIVEQQKAGTLKIVPHPEAPRANDAEDDAPAPDANRADADPKREG